MAVVHQGFQGLLYSKFILGDQYPVKKIAKMVGVSPTTFYSYCEGVSYFPPDLIALLYTATGDKDFLTFITNETDQRLAPREGAEGRKSVLEETLDVAAAHGDLVKKVQEALADDNISELERRKLSKSISESHKELEDLKNVLNAPESRGQG